MHSDSTETKRAWNACFGHLPKVSRTFALAIEGLPEPLRGEVCVSYLLCRIVDTIEDEILLPPALRAELFDEFSRLLADDSADPERLELAFAGLPEGSADRLLCRHAGAAFREFRALPRDLSEAARPHVAEILDAHPFPEVAGTAADLEVEGPQPGLDRVGDEAPRARVGAPRADLPQNRF